MKAATGVSAVFANGKATTKKASEVSSTESASLRSRRPADIVDRKASLWFSAAVVIDAGIAICFQCPISRLAKDGQNALRFKSANLIESAAANSVLVRLEDFFESRCEGREHLRDARLE